MTVNKININNRGVTLLELMVSISIFSLMLVAVFSVSSNVITGQREAIALQDASENIRYFMEVASKEIRMTRGNKDGVALNCPGGITNNKTFNINAASSELYFQNKDDRCVIYAENGGRIEVSRDGGANFFPVTSDKILISNLQFIVDDDAAGNVRTQQTSVTISLDVEYRFASRIHKNKNKIQTTISSRRYE
jgi:prepilin-type N-terminal cleavage/methylation domain-containing protein